MQLEIPDYLIGRAEATAAEMLTAMAIQLCADNRLDHVDAATLAGLDEMQFARELFSRGISVHIYPTTIGPQRKAG